ncbi:MAG: divalent metal cation transporter [Deltaproteobacteria bacterium]|nr:divalent metal cation transporter [Deltaproteobacteria bacterium]
MKVQEHNEMRWRTLLNVIGPGILFAGSAIGGSHLVQSTRAGALYGFKLLLIILLVNVFKYPFFQFAYRYTAATGESVLKGYRRLGRWALVVFFLVSFITSGINSAGVLLVTAGLAGFFFNITLHPFIISAGLLLIILMILLYGHYGWLDRIMKIMVVLLSISTTIAFTAALHK